MIPKISRLTEDEEKLKQDIINIVKQLNDKIHQAEKHGMNISLDRKIENDGTDNCFKAVTLQISLNI